jgi:hypothetical protein
VSELKAGDDLTNSLVATPISDAITRANLGSAMSCKQSLATAQAKKHTTDTSRSNFFQNVLA